MTDKAKENNVEVVLSLTDLLVLLDTTTETLKIGSDGTFFTYNKEMRVTVVNKVWEQIRKILVTVKVK